MKKLLPILSLFFLLSASPALAKQDRSGTSALNTCSEEVENHGQYVSCVAQLHLGGNSVSVAAHSEIGKDQDDDLDDDDEDENEDDDDRGHRVIKPRTSPSPVVSPTPSPSGTPSASPSPVVSPSPSGTPSASPSPLTAGTQINAEMAGVIGKVIENLQNLIAQLQKLILE